MPSSISQIHRTLQTKASTSFGVQDSQPRDSRARFQVAVQGTGESRLTGTNALKFGAYMTEVPTFSFGVIATAVIGNGALPQATAVVLRYLQNENGLYTAAEMGFVVASLQANISLRFSLTFEGSALRIPVGGDGSLGNPAGNQNNFTG